SYLRRPSTTGHHDRLAGRLARPRPRSPNRRGQPSQPPSCVRAIAEDVAALPPWDRCVVYLWRQTFAIWRQGRSTNGLSRNQSLLPRLAEPAHPETLDQNCRRLPCLTAWQVWVTRRFPSAGRLGIDGLDHSLAFIKIGRSETSVNPRKRP